MKGEKERACCYGPIISELKKYLPIPIKIHCTRTALSNFLLLLQMHKSSSTPLPYSGIELAIYVTSGTP